MNKEESNELIEQARELYKSQLYDVAAEFYQAAYDISDAPFKVEDFNKMADSYYEINNFEAAAIYLKRAIDIQSNVGELLLLYVQLADTYERASNEDEAVEVYKKLLRIYVEDKSISGADLEMGFASPFLSAINYKIAKLYLRQDKVEDGLEYLCRSIDFGHEEAKKEYKKITSLTYVSGKEETLSYIQKATRYFFDQDYTKAAKEYKNAFIIIPEVFESFDLFGMGISCYHIQDYSMADTCLHGAAVLEEENIRRKFYSYFLLSHLQKKLNNEEKASHYLAQPFALSKDNYDKSIAYYQYGKVADALGNPQEAIDNYKIAITHFLDHLSSTKAYVMAGEVKNEELGELYFNIAITLYKVENGSRDNIAAYMKKAALCGYKSAIGIAKGYEVKG